MPTIITGLVGDLIVENALHALLEIKEDEILLATLSTPIRLQGSLIHMDELFGAIRTTDTLIGVLDGED